MLSETQKKHAGITQDEPESLLPELLHALNQPLTSLRCSLEMTLLQPRDSEEYRKRLRDSLRLAEEITTLAAGIREMVNAEHPSETQEQIDVSKLLGMTVREFLPVAASNGVEVSLLCAPSLSTIGDKYHFSKALFYLLDFVLSHGSKGDELTIQAGRDHGMIDLAIELFKHRAPVSPIRDPRAQQTVRTYLAFLIGRRMLEVDGARVEVERETGKVSLRIRLRNETRQPDDEASNPGAA